MKEGNLRIIMSLICKKGCGEAGETPEMGHKDNQNLENLACEERLTGFYQP